MNSLFSASEYVRPPLAVTTCQKADEILIERAKNMAIDLTALYTPRRNVTINRVIIECNARRLLILYPDYWRLYDTDTGTVYAYHPNMIVVRGLNIVRGQRDLFAEATALEAGQSILDCTLGFGAEAILASYLVGDTGMVVGLESVPELAAVTREGLTHFKLQTKVLQAAMRRVNVVTADYRAYLPRCATHAYDVVYFDPFFEERLPGSETAVSPLEFFGNSAPIDSHSIMEARRVAKRCVVIKHPKWERLPDAIAQDVSRVVTTRKGRLDYSIFEPL